MARTVFAAVVDMQLDKAMGGVTMLMWRVESLLPLTRGHRRPARRQLHHSSTVQQNSFLQCQRPAGEQPLSAPSPGRPSPVAPHAATAALLLSPTRRRDVAHVHTIRGGMMAMAHVTGVTWHFQINYLVGNPPGHAPQA